VNVNQADVFPVGATQVENAKPGLLRLDYYGPEQEMHSARAMECGSVHPDLHKQGAHMAKRENGCYGLMAVEGNTNLQCASEGID
jgi:hypothetical protein